MRSAFVRLILACLLLGASTACQSVQLATKGAWSGYIVPVNLYDGHATYRAAEIRIVDGPEIPVGAFGTPHFRAILDDPGQYDAPEGFNPVLTDERNQPLDLSALSSVGLVRVEGLGGGGVALSADQKKLLYVALYNPAPPPHSPSGIGLRPSATIQVTRITDSKGRRIIWGRVTEPDTANTIPPPKLAWHDVHWLRAHLLGLVVRSGDDNWRVSVGGADMSAEKGNSGEFIVKFSYSARWTHPMDPDLRAFLTLQRTWNDRSHGRNHPLPQGLTEAHLSQLAPLLEPMGLPVEESASQRLASRLADLAAKARGTTVGDPNLLADERALVMELIDATRTPVDRQTSAWQQRIAAVKAQVGEPVWASLSPSQLHRT